MDCTDRGVPAKSSPAYLDYNSPPLGLLSADEVSLVCHSHLSGHSPAVDVAAQDVSTFTEFGPIFAFRAAAPVKFNSSGRTVVLADHNRVPRSRWTGSTPSKIDIKHSYLTVTQFPGCGAK